MTKSYKAEMAESMSDSKPEYVRICFGPRTMQVIADRCRSRTVNLGQAPSNNKPTHTLRCGNIKATIWGNVSEKGWISPARGVVETVVISRHGYY
jgi:hypothetical protein